MNISLRSIATAESAANTATAERQNFTPLSLAARELAWHSVWTPEETFARTAAWYRDFYASGTLRTTDDIDAYILSAQKEGLSWTR